MRRQASCPKCGGTTLLVAVPVVFAITGRVDDNTTYHTARKFGDDNWALVRGSNKAWCNSAHCRWEGPVYDTTAVH